MHKDIKNWNYMVGTSIYYTEENLFDIINNKLALIDEYDYYSGGLVGMFSIKCLTYFKNFIENNIILKKNIWYKINK